jgi:hypothetical protein
MISGIAIFILNTMKVMTKSEVAAIVTECAGELVVN